MNNFSIAEFEARWARMSDSQRKQECFNLARTIHSFVSHLPDWMVSPRFPQDGTEKADGEQGSVYKRNGMTVEDDCVLVWEGATWFVRFRDEERRVRDRVGLRYIAVLLANPESRYSPLELAQACGRFKEPGYLHHVDLDAEGMTKEHGFSYQLKTDQQTIAKVRRRYEELEEIRFDNPSDDLSRKEQLEALDKYLRQVTSGSGRARSFRDKSRGLPSARAVGKAIIDCFEEMTRYGLHGLTRHLRNGIRPYTDPVVYLPDDDNISWLVTGPLFSTCKVGKSLVKSGGGL